MITEERVMPDTSRWPSRHEQELRNRRTRSAQPSSRSAGPSLLWRLVFVLVGFGLAVLGWSLIMTAILSFIGLPVFIFGLALMQAQES